MNETEFRQELKRGLSGAYFFYGDEEYLKKFYLNRALIQAVGTDADASSWNTYIIPGKKSKKDSPCLDALEEAICAVPMMGERVFVQYTADFTILTDEETDALISLMKTVDEETVLLTVVSPEVGFDPGKPDKGRPSALYKKLSAVSKPVELNRMKDGEMKKWIARRLSHEGVAVTAEGAAALIARCGSSMLILSGELDKLAAYANANSLSEIGKNEVEAVCMANEEEDAFALANAVLQGDRRTALKALNRCKAAREEPITVLSRVSKSLCDMLTVCILMSEGASKSDISQKLKMHEYRAGLYMNAVKNENPRRLTAALGRCREADLKMKGAVPGYTALERFICTLPSGRNR